jgi:molybdate transport system ATP-binding protein
LASIQVPGGTLHVALRDAAPDQPVRVQLLARDLILAIEAPRGLSVRNTLSGKVAAVTPEADDAVLVTVDLGGAQALSRVTRDAAQALGLSPGQTVWVLVKAVSLHGHAFALAPPPA